MGALAPDNGRRLDDALFSSAAREFLATLVVDPSVDWPAWASTAEAQRLRDVAAVADATPEQLVKLMTWIVRSDRFVEGSIEGAYESGVLGAIIARAAELAKERDATND